MVHCPLTRLMAIAGAKKAHTSPKSVGSQQLKKKLQQVYTKKHISLHTPLHGSYRVVCSHSTYQWLCAVKVVVLSVAVCSCSGSRYNEVVSFFTDQNSQQCRKYNKYRGAFRGGEKEREGREQRQGECRSLHVH